MISSRGKTKRCFTLGMPSSRLRAKQYPSLCPSREKSQHLRLELPHCQHGRHLPVDEFYSQPSYQNRRMSRPERSTKRRIIVAIRCLAETSRLSFLSNETLWQTNGSIFWMKIWLPVTLSLCSCSSLCFSRILSSLSSILLIFSPPFLSSFIHYKVSIIRGTYHDRVVIFKSIHFASSSGIILSSLTVNSSSFVIS